MTTTSTTMNVKSPLPRSPVRAQSSSKTSMKSTSNTLFTDDQGRAILENYDLEAVERRRLIQEELEIALNQLKRRFGKEIARLTKGSTINLTVAEFLDEHGGNLNEAVKAMNDKKMESKEEDNNNEIERTIRKRKRIPAVHGSVETTEDDSASVSGYQISPIKPRKTPRVAPPTPNSRFPPTLSAAPKSASRNRLHSGSRAKTLNYQQPSQSNSNAANFVYRARPSLAAHQTLLNPRLPQTPQFRQQQQQGEGNGNKTGDISNTTRRMPRRHESIQAYSMNGSPLGILDLAIENANPNSTKADLVGSSTDDWEALQSRIIYPNHSAAIPASTISFAHPSSPNKLPHRKGSTTATASSSFKAAIVAGASKVKGKSRAFSHTFTESSTASIVPPSRNEFTFTAPPSQPQQQRYQKKAKDDLADRVQSLRSELDGMSIEPEDRRRLEMRMTEMLQTTERQPL